MRFVHDKQRSKIAYLLFAALLGYILPAPAQQRWSIQADGSIAWQVKGSLPHHDHLEMSGQQISSIIRYGVNADSSYHVERSLVWPLLRTIPNNTHASLNERFGIDYLSAILVNGRTIGPGHVKKITLNGILQVISEFEAAGAKVEVKTSSFPSRQHPVFCEQYEIKNCGNERIQVCIPNQEATYHTDPKKGVDGPYQILSQFKGKNHSLYYLDAGEQCVAYATIQAFRTNESPLPISVEDEITDRGSFLAEIKSKLVLRSPDSILNKAFEFSKIRAAESIYKTKGGYMHGPGGEAFYAAIWANDQAEYTNPFFPFLGYQLGNASAINAFRHFARFINAGYKPLPSSIISEGDDIWAGAGDRGDAAMIAYGAARYALARGDKAEAVELWELLTWCLEYCHRKLNKEGVVTSDSDELEGRFPSGKANLCTSSLYYDALLSAINLGNELKKPKKQLQAYATQAQTLRKAIDAYFGATVQGFTTYRYYAGNDTLRSWICIPLTVGILNRKQGTINALFSPKLWTENGLLTQSGTHTFWDRSTLYGLRGIFAAGEREKALTFLKNYSAKRLLGEHVPYPIEAWPEGQQRHLSAESALYCRVITEGLFGIRPTGFRSFSLCPQLPEAWDNMELDSIAAFGHTFSIKVTRAGPNKQCIQVINGKGIYKTIYSKIGDSLNIHL